MSDLQQSDAKTEGIALLAGGGEMGERTRSFDWSKTPVGPVNDWPQALKTVVRVMLDSRYAMWLGWGPEFTFFYNDAYAAMTLGPKHPWALGRAASQVWSEIWADIGPRADSVIRTGKATWDEGLLLFLERRGFREETYHTFSYSPVPDDRGGVGGMLCVVTEDTERTIGERRLRTLRELAARTADHTTSVENACLGAAQILSGNTRDVPFALIYLLDSEGRRATFVAASGLEPGTPISPGSVLLEGDPSPWPFREVAESNKAVVVCGLPESLGTLPGGAWPEPSTQALVLPMAKPGQSQLAGFIVAGISPRRPFDDAYRGFLELLAGQVASTVAGARAFEEEKRRSDALAELDHAKTVFFSNVSHEFRTPLTLMLGPVEDLLARSYTDLPPAAASQLEVVNRNGLRLLRLVNTLLDFSRIEAGRVRAIFQPTDLAAFTSELASNFRSACERAGLRLSVDCPPLPEPVYVDRGMWEKIVLNLLSNAFKFTFEGEIGVVLRQTGKSVSLTVADTGTGIPAEELPRLFERFHRIENSRGRTHEGTGIGLALVQELVKLHGGSIRARSAAGQGTTFTIELLAGKSHLPAQQLGGSGTAPATPDEAGLFVEEALRWLPGGGTDVERNRSELPVTHEAIPAPLDQATRSPDDRPFVLVADDNADMRQYVSRLLADQYQVEAVPDGELALAAALDRRPDLILTDVMMPRLDGVALMKAVRADARTSGIPVIMLSARAGEESRVEGLEAGADDYLVKPFSARELLARVGTHLQMNRLRRESEERERRLAMEAATSSAQFRAFFEQGALFAGIMHTDGTILEPNRLSLEACGYTRDEVVGRLFWDCPWWNPSPALAERIKSGSAQAASGETFRAEMPYFVADGTERMVDLIILPIKDSSGRVIFLAPTGTDITDRKRAEEALKDANRRKDEFLATLAHELRNPLAPLRNGLQIIRLASGDQATVELAGAMMERQLEQLVHLVDDLLDLSRISLGMIVLRKEHIELAKVVQQAVETSRPLVDSRAHKLFVYQSPEPILVNADKTRLTQVIANLLNNAAKYTECGGQITLKAVRHGSEAVLSVRDNGAGIPAHMLPKIFDMFTQVDRSLERSQGGLGIGLSLVKGLIEQHGGSVEARSDGHGTGSEFIIRLPVEFSKSSSERTMNAENQARLNVAHRILVVDDNRDAATSLAIMFKLMGNETRTAHDGLEALDAAATFRPDMVMLDIGMPRLNGFDTARRMREQPWCKDAVLVALTGWGQEEDKRRSLEAGFNFHLVKPIDLAAIEKLLAGLQVNTG